MKTIKWKDTICLSVIIITIIGFIYLCLMLFSLSTQRNQEEICRFGNITIDIDSVKAVDYINQHRDRLSQRIECNIPLIIKGDSIGYTYKVYNKEYESFYIKVKNGKVYQMWFKSNYITNKDVLAIHKDSIVKFDGKPFKHIGKTFTFEFDGKNKYIVTKN